MIPLFSIAYLPPLSFINKCIETDKIIIEKHEHFIKQTYRNRCNIYGPNGKQSLIIPVVHENHFRIPIKDIRISTDIPWNKIHWKSICSAYRNSPYFEYYEEDLEKIFQNSYKFLFDFNMALLNLVFQIFKIESLISFTDSFEKHYENVEDLRNSIHPKFISKDITPYHQVFSDRHGFIKDLSCIDYLFNEGLSEN